MHENMAADARCRCHNVESPPQYVAPGEIDSPDGEIWANIDSPARIKIVPPHEMNSPPKESRPRAECRLNANVCNECNPKRLQCHI